MRDSDQEIRQFDVAYFMASVDSLEDNKAFAEKNGASFPILSDADKQMSQAFGALSPGGLARRWTFYIDRQGIVRKIDKAVSPRTAGAELVKNLQALKAPRRP
ncbi:peroxiredoxin family protein [Pseudomonadales bacterium]|nr:peroxiredoxin family protein [Pseudomonadales bacterium]